MQSAASRLRAAGVDEPRLEATLLLGHLLSRDRACLLAHPELTVSSDLAERFGQLLDRRARAEPIAYLIGEREFYGRSFVVDQRALVPRPETELLVETALEQLAAAPGVPLVVDVGTGSGGIAATLALEAPGCRIVAADISTGALEVARLNLARHGLGERVRLVRGDLLAWLRAPADLVVANLPYVPREALSALPADVRCYEPRLALDGGPGGARLLRALLEQAAELGVGTLLAELDPRHAEEVLAVARERLPHRQVAVLDDLAGRPRLLRVRPRLSLWQAQGRL